MKRPAALRRCRDHRRSVVSGAARIAATNRDLPSRAFP